MKKIFFIFLLAIMYCNVYSQTVLSNARSQAKKENKYILLNFSGSDWCIPCIRMEKEYFKNESFIKMADSALVVIRADFPRKKINLPAKNIVKENELLADQFNPDGSFPLTLLMNADGLVIRKWDGLPEADPGAFTKEIIGLTKK